VIVGRSSWLCTGVRESSYAGRRQKWVPQSKFPEPAFLVPIKNQMVTPDFSGGLRKRWKK